jgi:hypothetical protein
LLFGVFASSFAGNVTRSLSLGLRSSSLLPRSLTKSLTQLAAFCSAARAGLACCTQSIETGPVLSVATGGVDCACAASINRPGGTALAVETLASGLASSVTPVLLNRIACRPARQRAILLPGVPRRQTKRR